MQLFNCYQIILLFGSLVNLSGGSTTVQPSSGPVGPLQLRAQRFRRKNIQMDIRDPQKIIDSFNAAVVRRNLKAQNDPWKSLYIVLCQISMNKIVSSADITCTNTIEHSDDDKREKAEKALQIVLGTTFEKKTGSASSRSTNPPSNPSSAGGVFSSMGRLFNLGTSGGNPLTPKA